MPRQAEWVDFIPGMTYRSECEEVGWEGHLHIYAFRCPYAGGIRPGKARESAFICYGLGNNTEIQMHSGQLLKKGNYEWRFGRDGSVPPNAVVAGNDPHGNPYYIGRAIINGTLTPGFVEPLLKSCYIPYNGVTNVFTSYCVLCFKDVECPKQPPQEPCPPKTCPKLSNNGDYGYGD